MIRLNWSVVSQLRLEPVGPISAGVFGLRYDSGANDWLSSVLWWTKLTAMPVYFVADPVRLRQTRDILGPLVYAPTNERPMSKHPWVSALEAIHRGVTK